MTSSLIVAVSALLSFAAAAPVQNVIHSGSLEARQAPSCNLGTQVDDLAAYDSSCWNTLDIMPYLTNWKATTPSCTDAANSAGQTLSCCGASEPWSTCFLRLATKQLNAYDCTQVVSTGSGPICSLEADGGRAFALDAGLDPTIASQVNYVVLNIIMINNFFATYYTGQLRSSVRPDLRALIINLALQTVTSNEGHTLYFMLSNSASIKMNLMDVSVDLQNAMAALTLGLAFREVRTSQISLSPSTKLIPPRSQPLGSAPSPPMAQPPQPQIRPSVNCKLQTPAHHRAPLPQAAYPSFLVDAVTTG